MWPPDFGTRGVTQYFFGRPTVGVRVMLPGQMDGDLIMYEFSRSKVERGDVSHFLGLYAAG